MRILLVHQNFPGQYKHLAAHLACQPENLVVALRDNANSQHIIHPAIRQVAYDTPRGASRGTHRYLHNLENAVRRGQAIANVCLHLRKQGFTPDLIFSHAGWGESLFLKDVFPEATVIGYFEFFYHAQGADVGFDPEFDPTSIDDACRLRIRNANHLLSLNACDQWVAPTHWQAEQFPALYRSGIRVIHEGIDTRQVSPDDTACFELPGGAHRLTRSDEVITFVARNLEPYRGFHVFMRALPDILRARPQAQVVIVGGDEVSYGKPPTSAKTWRQVLLNEVGNQLDLARIHFTGKIPYDSFLKLLQVSSVHVYLTYPFVLSWSMLEAMSAGCIVVGSRTPPVEEVIKDGSNGFLADFFNREGELVEKVLYALERQKDLLPLRQKAREHIIRHYDLQTVCLPQQIRLVNDQGKR